MSNTTTAPVADKPKHNPLALPGQKVVNAGKTTADKAAVAPKVETAPVAPNPLTKDEQSKLSKSVAVSMKKADAELKTKKAAVAKKPAAKPSSKPKAKPEAKKAPAKPVVAAKPVVKPLAPLPKAKEVRITAKITPTLTPERQKEIDKLIAQRDIVRKDKDKGVDSKEYAALSTRIRVLRNPEGVEAANKKRRQSQTAWLAKRYAEDPKFREKQVKATRAWRSKNKDRVAKYNDKRKDSAQFKGAVKVRNTITCGLSRPKTKCGPKRDAKKFSGLVGCSRETFQKHIESQFTKAMNWDNRGTAWTISFEKQLSEFDLTTDEGLRKAAHYKNVIVVAYAD